MDFSKILDYVGGVLNASKFGIKYVVALFAVLILILLASWLLRKFTEKVRTGGRRNGRLEIQETVMIDRSRSLAVVSCDDVEHLLLLGGASDVVVASDLQNVLRASQGGPATPPATPPLQSPTPQSVTTLPSQSTGTVRTAAAPKAPPPPKPMPHIPPAAPIGARQKTAAQPLPSSTPRTISSIPTNEAPGDQQSGDTMPKIRSIRDETVRINGEDATSEDSSMAPSLSNFRPGGEK